MVSKERTRSGVGVGESVSDDTRGLHAGSDISAHRTAGSLVDSEGKSADVGGVLSANGRGDTLELSVNTETVCEEVGD